MKTHTFNGKRFRIDIAGPIDGICISGEQLPPQDREVILCRNLNTQGGLITVIHESLHACEWHIGEQRIDQISRDVGRFLWRLGYRIKKDTT